MQYLPNIAKEHIYVQRYGITLDAPLEFFGLNKCPNWWDAYNGVKHERDENFKLATLENALQAHGESVNHHSFLSRKKNRKAD